MSAEVFQILPDKAATTADVVHAHEVIDDVIATIRMTNSTGSELHACVCGLLRYGNRDPILKAALDRIQKHIETR